MLAPGTGEVASAVRSTPCTTQGWRPLSVTTQPAITATKPSHQPCATGHRYQRLSNSRPRHHSQAPTRPAAIIRNPMPTMMRKAKNTGTTGGRSAGGTLLRPGNRPSGSCLRMSEAPCGIEISKRFSSAFSSGQANSTSAPGLLPSQCASIAAILIGWCSSVLSPCWSPISSLQRGRARPACRCPCASWSGFPRRGGRPGGSVRRPRARPARWSDTPA